MSCYFTSRNMVNSICFSLYTITGVTLNISTLVMEWVLNYKRLRTYSDGNALSLEAPVFRQVATFFFFFNQLCCQNKPLKAKVCRLFYIKQRRLEGATPSICLWNMSGIQPGRRNEDSAWWDWAMRSCPPQALILQRPASCLATKQRCIIFHKSAPVLAGGARQDLGTSRSRLWNDSQPNLKMLLSFPITWRQPVSLVHSSVLASKTGVCTRTISSHQEGQEGLIHTGRGCSDSILCSLMSFVFPLFCLCPTDSFFSNLLSLSSVLSDSSCPLCLIFRQPISIHAWHKGWILIVALTKDVIKGLCLKFNSGKVAVRKNKL